jgi:ABC-2 type transport system permease protein
MKKYLEIGKINFLNNIFYFSEFLMKAFFILLILFIFTNIWRAVYADKAVIEGFSITMMIWYFLLTEAIVTSSSGLVREVNREIQSGDIAYQLNKPYNYILYHLSKNISYRILGVSTVFFIGSILVYFMVGGFNFNLVYLPFIIITVLLALILDFFMVMGISLLAFWFEDTNSFKWVYDKIIFTLGGMLIPLEIFPKWLGSISSVLPFSFVAYHPAKLFVTFNFLSFFKVISIQLVYIALFGVISLIIYRTASRRLTINGG